MKLPQNCRPNVTLRALLPALLIAGCATPSTISTGALMALPERPPSLQPAPSEAYSTRASRNIEMWRMQLTDILPRQPPVAPPGRSE